MNIDIIISHEYIDEERLKGKTAVVIDTLRATSVMTTAVLNGVKRIIPVMETEEAIRLREKLISEGESVILGGERKGLKIEGFDLSNSPLEYKKDVVSGKTLIMTTSNGTRTMNKCTGADTVVIGAMINAKAAALFAGDTGKDIVMVNSGTKGNFSLDDFITSGYMVSVIKEKDPSVSLTDIAYMSLELYRKNKDIISAMEGCFHYNYLKSIGYEKDLEYCLTKDMTQVVPVLENGQIRKAGQTA